MIGAVGAARLVAAGLIATAVVVGTTSDRSAPRPAEERAGYRVLHGDFHAHTRFSDGVVSPFDLVLHARRQGLDVIGVTEHNSVWPGKLARAFAPHVDGAPVVVVGEEVTTKELHMLALGIERDVDARASPAEVAAEVHAQGGVIVAAHPTKRFWPALLPICDRIDGVEVVHPIAFRGTSPIGSWAEMVEVAEGRCGRGRAMIGNSDFHGGNVLGVVRTYVFVEEVSERGVVGAIAAGRTVTYGPDGRGFGPPELIAALAEQPLADRAPDYGYRAHGPVDRWARVGGWLGLMVLFALGPTRLRGRASPTLG